MPIYEYRCLDCGETFELRRSVNADDVGVKCPKCGVARFQKIVSVFTAPGGGSGDNCSPFSSG